MQQSIRSKLSESLVKNLPLPDRANKIHYDSEVPGFGCRVTAKGSKSFVLNYVANGRERRFTIGRWPGWSTSAAREEAKRLKRDVDIGHDPLGDREKRRNAESISELCDRYLAEHVAVHNKPSTAREATRLVEKVIRPRLGGFKVEHIERQEIIKLHTSLSATPKIANHALAVLSKIFNLAELWGMRPDHSNPVRHIRRYPVKKRDRWLNGEELARLGQALEDMEGEGRIAQGYADAIRFLAFTGMRPGEACGLRWDWIDFQRGIISLPDAKTGARDVAFGSPAATLLSTIERQGEHVFSNTSGRPIKLPLLERKWAGETRRGSKRQGVRGRAGLEGVVLHDLRHTVGTYAGGAGLNAFMIRDLLGHKTLAMTGQYVEKNTDPLRAAADQVSKQIAAAMSGKGAEVVRLKTGSSS